MDPQFLVLLVRHMGFTFEFEFFFLEQSSPILIYKFCLLPWTSYNWLQPSIQNDSHTIVLISEVVAVVVVVLNAVVVLDVVATIKIKLFIY